MQVRHRGFVPALTARPPELLDDWLRMIAEDLAAFRAAEPNAIVGPLAVNQIVHESNPRLDHDVRVCIEHRVPIFITSLRAPPTRSYNKRGCGPVI
jgi:nitronate monooxygenase